MVERAVKAGQPLDFSSIRGELRVLRLTVSMMIIYAALNFAAIFRLIGFTDLPAILLTAYRVIDVVIITSFFYYCGPKIKIRSIDFLLLFFVTYPVFIGIMRSNISLTFFNDIAIFFSFVLKIIVFRTVLVRISRVIDIDVVFRDSAKKIIFWCGLIALVSLAFATALVAFGARFYYQAPAELTFAAALALAHGRIGAYLLLLGLALASGKRMVMIGLLVMGAIVVMTRPKLRAAMLRYAIPFVLITAFILILSSTLLNSELVFVDKIFGTFRQWQRASERSTNFLEMIMHMDPVRYVEYVSLKDYLTDWSLWFGNGYGFRYALDLTFLQEFGYTESVEVTNAHFTPLAITAKFGLLGLAVWFTLIRVALASRINKESIVQYACRLAFYSVIIQSLFAFGFFVNIFTPFYFAMVSLDRHRTARKLDALEHAPQKFKFSN